MKVLLAAVNAKYIHSNPAVYSLRAYAAGYSQSIEIAEYTINQRTEAILADLYERRPRMIAFSCYIWNWRMIRELLWDLQQILPDTDIWLGGPEVSYNAPTVLKTYPWLTGIMVGEGEETFRELMGYYCGENIKLTDVSGVCLPGIVMTPARELLEMDRLPFPYEDTAVFENRIIYYESSRGCPYGCSYCLSGIDKRVRWRSLPLVERELDFFLERNVAQVKFVDRTFNCRREHALAVWRYLAEHDNGVTNFHFEIAAELLQAEEIALLQSVRPGLFQLEIGVQSTNPDTLRAIHRRTDLKRLREAVGQIRAGKRVHLHLDLIAGLPYEDYDSFSRSFDDVYAMHPHQLQLGFLKVLKGSPLYEKTAEYGIAYSAEPPYEVLYTRWLSYAEVRRLKRVEEMVELYYNSGQFRHTLKALEHMFDSPFRLYEELGAFYEAHGYVVNHPSRSRRYDILLEFACSRDGERAALYRELLTFDLYLREKCKSRPAFACDLASFRTALRAYEEDKADHVEPFFYPVWADSPQEMEVRRNMPAYVRFHYAERNPLYHDAETVIL